MDVLMKHAVAREEAMLICRTRAVNRSTRAKKQKIKERIAKSKIHVQVTPHTLGLQEVRTTMECVNQCPCEPPQNKSQMRATSPRHRAYRQGTQVTGEALATLTGQRE